MIFESKKWDVQDVQKKIWQDGKNFQNDPKAMHTLTHKFSLIQGLVHTASASVDTQTL